MKFETDRSKDVWKDGKQQVEHAFTTRVGENVSAVLPLALLTSVPVETEMVHPVYATSREVG